MKFNRAKIKTLSRLGTCGAYGLAMLEMPQMDDKVVACTADLCFYSGLERFSQEFPENFYNVGIAEQNLVGIAGGLAHEGFKPYVSTYASFACTRALDQVKVNMGYMQLPIRLIGLTSGLSVGILGPTHICMEDIAIMRSIPNLTIISPADAMETVKVIQALVDYQQPVYVRLSGTMNMPSVYLEDYEYSIGKAITLREGKDIAIVATGTMVATAIEVAEKLSAYDVSCKIINMHTIKPLDANAIDELKEFKCIVSIEEHSRIGGLGSAVAEYITTQGGFPRLEIIGMDDKYPHAAEYGYLIEKCGLTAEHIANRLCELLQV